MTREQLLEKIRELKAELSATQRALAAERHLLKVSRDDYWRLHAAFDRLHAELARANAGHHGYE